MGARTENRGGQTENKKEQKRGQDFPERFSALKALPLKHVHTYKLLEPGTGVNPDFESFRP